MEIAVQFGLLIMLIVGALLMIGSQTGYIARPTSEKILHPPGATLMSIHKAMLCKFGVNTQPKTKKQV
ncbi:MAG: hypothetical protein G01um101448_766 [Parcubacteria group bacterium Gr01-1014_48]|nr:MAG: hypothetical protein Greene041614_926 [Parcubacteria group bacterium Greene0416_14]TSC73454.1 MAG: hypothetical protein G01um101448_766 [Parcubacteria group bacterium Gr01-1014_48]